MTDTNQKQLGNTFWSIDEDDLLALPVPLPSGTTSRRRR